MSPELVKHILVTGVVGQNVKADVKISNICYNHTRVVVCGRCAVMLTVLKVVRNCIIVHFVVIVLQKAFFGFLIGNCPV